MQLALLLLFLLAPCVTPLTFDFPSFPNNESNTRIIPEGDAFIDGQFLRLTNSAADAPNKNDSVGRATYSKPFLLREKATGRLADFTTHFKFVIDSQNDISYGDGLAFFIAPSETKLNSTLGTGASMGLPVDSSFSSPQNLTDPWIQYPFVAVEFDIFQNIDQNIHDPIGDHVGIDVNSLMSKTTAYWNGSIPEGKINSAWIRYNSSSKNLSVTYTDYSYTVEEYRTFSYILDLEHYLRADEVIVGFSAATGSLVALHKIVSWSFNSTELKNATKNPSVPAPSPTSVNPKFGDGTIGLKIGIGIFGCVLLFGGLGLVWFICWKKRPESSGETTDEDPVVRDLIDDNEFEKGTGPRKFSYAELALAASNFEEANKLGEGGFGGVYRGFIKDLSSDVAVKKISRGSKQGLKEYAAEVRIISRLRHRNVVQLIGWCHQKKLLLVYEFMPNGSLDSHLFKAESVLPWETRYRIAKDLASGLRYLHEDGQQCVLHRDIKSSNVMLDSDFTAKLGDFGLARLVDHGKESQTTVVAGTRGYMALEYLTTGKASKESDIYSFGVVALEIACGRIPIAFNLGSSQINMVEWVWELYGQRRVIEAADPKLGRDFDEKQMECLMIVGLWCAHPGYNFRPSIKQAIQVLNFEVPLPDLPLEMPAFHPPMTNSTTGSQGSQTESSYGNNTTQNSSQFTASSTTNSHPSISTGSHECERVLNDMNE